MAFRLEAVKEQALMPVAGAGTFLLAELVAASIDAQRADQKPYAQNTVSVVGAVGGLYGIGANKATKFSLGVLMGVAVGLIANGLKYAYDTVTKQATRLNPADVGAMIAPRKVGTLPAGGALDKGMKLDLGKIGGQTKEAPSMSASVMEI